MASSCPNEGICHSCGKAGHRARECPNPELPPGDLRLCNNCYKQGHFAADCTNDKACKNCRKTGHLARDCQNEPVCNLCNISGHVARQCPKGDMIGPRGGGGGGFRGGGGGYRDVICRNCNQVGHMSRDCMAGMVICHTCGGRGHMAFECPSGRFMDRMPPRRYWIWRNGSFACYRFAWWSWKEFSKWRCSDLMLFCCCYGVAPSFLRVVWMQTR